MTVHVLVEAVALVYFDHDHGPHFAEIYPENYLDTLALPEYALYSDYLSVKWRDQIRFSALPDDRRIANEPFCDAKPPTQYLFFLHNPSDLLSLNPSFCGLEAASLASHTNYESHDSNHVVDSKDSIAAYVIHSRELDPDSKRGIYQSSVVLLSRRPYNSFYFQLYSLFDGLQCSKEIYNCLTDTFSKHIKSKEAFHIRLSNNHIYSVLFTETGLIQCARAGESTNGLAKSKGQLKPFLQNCGEYLWDVYESIFLNIPIVVYGVDPEHVSQTVLVLHQFVVSSSGLTFEGLVSPIVTLHDDYVKSLITNMKHNGNLKNKISKSGGFIVGTMNPILVELAVKSKVVTIIRLPGPQLAPHSDPKLPRCGSQPLLEAHPKLPLKTPQDGEGDLQTEPPRTAPLDIPKTEKNIDFVISSSPSSQSILKKLMGPIKNLSSNSLSGYSSLPAELADGNPVPVSFSAEVRKPENFLNQIFMNLFLIRCFF